MVPAPLRGRQLYYTSRRLVSRSGTFATFAASRRASSLVSSFAVSAGGCGALGASMCQINRLAKDTAEVLMALNTFARIRRPSPPPACVPHRAARGIGHKPDHRACHQSSGTWRRLRRPVRSIGLGPEHDWSSHAADAFGYMAIAYEEP